MALKGKMLVQIMEGLYLPEIKRDGEKTRIQEGVVRVPRSAIVSPEFSYHTVFVVFEMT